MSAKAKRIASSGIRDVSLTLGAQLATIVTSLGTQILLARLLGAEGRGAYAACIVFASMLAMFFTFGRLSGAGYLLAAGKLNLSQAVVNAVVYGGIGSLAAMAIGYALLHLPIQFFDRAPREAFFLALLKIAPLLFTQGFIYLLAAYRDFTGAAVFTVLNGVFQIALTLFFVGLLSWDVVGGVAAMVLAGAFNSTGMLLYMRFRHGLGLALPSLGKLRRIFSYGIRVYFGNISRSTNMQIGTLILAASPAVSQEDLGIYAAVVALCVRIQVLPDALNRVLMPRVAGDAAGRRELIAQCARVMLVLMGGIGLGLVLFARPVVLVVFSAEFLDGVNILRLIVPGILLRSVAKMYIPYLKGTNRPGIASIGSFTALVLDTGLLLLLLPVLGLWGAAIAVSAAWSIEAVVLFGAFKRFSGVGLSEMVGFRRSDWRPLAKKLRKRTVVTDATTELPETEQRMDEDL